MSMVSFILVAAILVSNGPTAGAFHTGRRRCATHIGGWRMETRRPVIVYSGEDYVEEENDFSTSGFTTAGASAATPPTDAFACRLMERLSSQCVKSLIRLACAFSPGASLHLKDVESAYIMDIDARHMEISAVLCETEGCVQVPVPVQFPAACAGSMDDMEECVLENIELLDIQAHQMIEQEEWNEDYAEERQDEQRLVHYLQLDPKPLEFPNWWTHPQLHQSGLAEQCADIKHLLNEEEFASELAALTQTRISNIHIGRSGLSDATVVMACIASVGPSGLIIKARLIEAPKGMEASRRTEDVVVSIGFGNNAENAKELKKLVLELVSSAMTD